MRKVTDLERFLRSQEGEGEKDSEGTFTVAQSKALTKLAGFQLPFKGAWALKIVQAAVAAGGCQRIRVSVSNYEQSFEFEGLTGWTLEETQTALTGVESRYDRALEHLVTGLRGVGFSDLRGFWLGLPGEDRALVWNGDSLQQTEMKTPCRYVKLSVTCKARFEQGGFFGLRSLMTARERNAITGQTLSHYAHTCPVPLIFDGRRLDSLELNPQHGWTKTSQVLALGFGDGHPPPLPVPKFTGAEVYTEYMVKQTVKTGTKKLRSRCEDRTHCSVAYLVCAHLELVGTGKSSRWETREGKSHCYWVADGVIVQAETAPFRASFCSVGVYLSADGLEPDLTSLHLVDSEEKHRRFRGSIPLLREGLSELLSCDLSGISQTASKNNKLGGAVCLLIGAGASVFSPVHGFIFLGLGAINLYQSRTAGKKTEEDLANGFSSLYSEFERKKAAKWSRLD